MLVAVVHCRRDCVAEICKFAFAPNKMLIMCYPSTLFNIMPGSVNQAAALFARAVARFVKGLEIDNWCGRFLPRCTSSSKVMLVSGSISILRAITPIALTSTIRADGWNSMFWPHSLRPRCNVVRMWDNVTYFGLYLIAYYGIIFRPPQSPCLPSSSWHFVSVGMTRWGASELKHGSCEEITATGLDRRNKHMENKRSFSIRRVGVRSIETSMCENYACIFRMQ